MTSGMDMLCGGHADHVKVCIGAGKEGSVPEHVETMDPPCIFGAKVT